MESSKKRGFQSLLHVIPAAATITLLLHPCLGTADIPTLTVLWTDPISLISHTWMGIIPFLPLFFFFRIRERREGLGHTEGTGKLQNQNAFDQFVTLLGIVPERAAKTLISWKLLRRLHSLPPHLPPPWAEGSVYQQQIKPPSTGTIPLLGGKASPGSEQE